MFGFMSLPQIGDVFRILPFSFGAGILFFAIRWLYLKSRSKPRSLWKEIFRAAFVLYCAEVLGLVWVPDGFWKELWFYIVNGWSDWNISPMFGGNYELSRLYIYRCFFGDLRYMRSERLMIIANVVMLIPFGFFLPLLWKRLKWWQVDLMALGTVLIIEIVQPVFGRSGDIDDVIANTAGAVIGCVLGKAVLLVFGKLGKKQAE